MPAAEEEDWDPADPERLAQTIARLPPSLRRFFEWAMEHWPGRIALRGAADLTALQIFDRSMTIAAQLFTSVFPIIIMGGALFGGDETSSLVGSLGGSESAKEVIDEVVVSGGAATFGAIGVLVVLVSATSLSRALTRAYDIIWHLPRRRTRLFDAWRWLAAVLVLALAVVLTRVLVGAVEPLPPREFWSTVTSMGISTSIALFVPWLLMAGRIQLTMLLPGALLYAVVMALASPIVRAYMPMALESSAERYGPIGVAFAYITYLYCLSFALLSMAALGQVIATDEGGIGRWIRRVSGWLAALVGRASTADRAQT